MELTETKLTVYFENPFWVGVYERQFGTTYEVCKITFGSEPKEYEVYEFLLKNWMNFKFSSSIVSDEVLEKRINPKRMQREIKKNLQDVGIGTKAQQALKLQHEQNKMARKKYSKQKREEYKEEQFILRQQKKKEKHRGH